MLSHKQEPCEIGAVAPWDNRMLIKSRDPDSPSLRKCVPSYC